MNSLLNPLCRIQVIDIAGFIVTIAKKKIKEEITICKVQNKTGTKAFVMKRGRKIGCKTKVSALNISITKEVLYLSFLGMLTRTDQL